MTDLEAIVWIIGLIVGGVVIVAFCTSIGKLTTAFKF